MEAKSNAELHPLPKKSVIFTQDPKQDDVDDDDDDNYAEINSAREPVWDRPREENFAIFRVKAENGEIIDKIPQMEAICIICNCLLQEDINVLMTKCRCRMCLLHEKCALEKRGNKKCNACKEDMEYIPVTLSTPTAEDLKKPSSPKRPWNRFPKLFRPSNRKTN